MPASFTYNGPPGRGFEPGATYELVYATTDPDWSPTVTQTRASTETQADAQAAAGTAPPTELSKENS